MRRNLAAYVVLLLGISFSGTRRFSPPIAFPPRNMALAFQHAVSTIK
jgi:hypothetical protein